MATRTFTVSKADIDDPLALMSWTNFPSEATVYGLEHQDGSFLKHAGGLYAGRLVTVRVEPAVVVAEPFQVRTHDGELIEDIEFDEDAMMDGSATGKIVFPFPSGVVLIVPACKHHARFAFGLTGFFAPPHSPFVDLRATESGTFYIGYAGDNYDEVPLDRGERLGASFEKLLPDSPGATLFFAG